jgi:PAS domain S-box-containing protein
MAAGKFCPNAGTIKGIDAGPYSSARRRGPTGTGLARDARRAGEMNERREGAPMKTEEPQAASTTPHPAAGIDTAGAAQHGDSGPLCDAEDALREARTLNTLILNSSRDCIVVLDLEGRTRFVSPGGIQSMEISDLPAVIGQSWLRDWTGADLVAAQAALAAASAGGTGRFEGFCPTHEGTPKWWDVVISSLPGMAGQPRQLVAIGRDVSAARHAGQRLAVAEERLAVALSASGVVGLWDWDVATGQIFGDANFARIYAFDLARAAAGATFAEYRQTFHPDDLAMIERQLERTFADQTEFSSEYRIVHPDASIHWIFARGRVVRDAQGAPARFAGTSIDITEHKSAELRQAFLLRLSDRLRGLPEPQAVLAAAAEELGQHLRASRVGFGQVHADDETVAFDGGYADGVEPIVGRFAMRCFGADNIARLRRGQTVVCDDVTADAGNDPAHWASLSTRSFVAVPLIRDGRLRSALYVNCCSGRHWSPDDVTLIQDVAARAWDALERARAERELRVSETRLLTAVAITSLGTFEWDTGSNGVTMSARARTIFGFDADEDVNAPDIFDRIHPQDVDRVRGEAMIAARDASPLETSYRIVLPGGALRWVRSVNDSVPVAAGQAVRQVGVWEDVTERMLAEQAMRTSELQFRTLAQSIPHHVWTATPDGRLDWLNDQTYAYAGEPGGTLEGNGWARTVHPEDVASNRARWSKSVASGAAFESEVRVRRSDGAYRWHMVRAVAVRNADGQIVRWVGTSTDTEEQHTARDAMANLNLTLEARVEQHAREREISIAVAQEPWNALIDPTQIENAVLNLALNGRDAMKGSGKLALTVSNVALDAAYAKSHVDVLPGDYVRLAVRDTGTGMTPEVMAQVFEPFFSTKPVGSGTGLGLSMVYGFVKQSGGHVEVQSRLGAGTTMALYLPRTERVEEALVLTDSGPVVGGTETILVAEDDEGVRATVVELLGELGYRVLKAKDAASALTVIESGVAIDLLFTDVVMPGTLKSLDLARIARQRLPGLAVLFTSGYTQNVITYGDRVEAGVELLPKPYTREALARRLRHVLASRTLPGGASAAVTMAASAPTAMTTATGMPTANADPAAALRVLLVEHNERIRSSTTELLQELGHTVAGAGSGEEAMTLLRASRIDVLMTDLGLPGMSGDVFAAEARAIQPELRIVFATGSALAPHVTGDGITPVLLLKPYDRAGLVAALAAARR